MQYRTLKHGKITQSIQSRCEEIGETGSKIEGQANDLPMGEIIFMFAIGQDRETFAEGPLRRIQTARRSPETGQLRSLQFVEVANKLARRVANLRGNVYESKHHRTHHFSPYLMVKLRSIR